MKTPSSTKGGAGLGRVLLHLLPGALICALFATVGVIHVTSRVLVVGVGYKLSSLENESRDLMRENDRLKLELATLKSPTRLETIAREQLGMGPPPAGAVITLSSDRPIRLGRRAPEKRAVKMADRSAAR
jgi:cell division protein FtsL